MSGPRLFRRVTASVYLLELHHRDPGVRHGGLQLLVPEHLGDEAHVGPRVEHQARRGVAKEATTPLLRGHGRLDVGAHQS